MSTAILALNAGSSSIKFGLFEAWQGCVLKPIARGEVEGDGGSRHFIAYDGVGGVIDERSWPDEGGTDQTAQLTDLLVWVDAHLGADKLVAVGHRVVHGGRDFTRPVRLDGHVLAALEALTPLAPLHQPQSLSPVRAIMSLRPELPQVACFDTAFHRTMPPVATRFALPASYDADGVRRYGFHGLSYEYITESLRETDPDLFSGRVIVAHLGNGASLCAVRDGCSVDTTMGFTALDGLMMGTRCGAIDPGVILYMLQQQKLSAGEVEEILYKQSGLLGVSGISGDMRALIGNADKRAGAAIELFVYRIAREAAALAGSLGGLDGFVFTGGIGEHVPEIRAAVCDRLGWLGVVADQTANARPAGRISGSTSRVEIRVIPTDEEIMIARHANAVLEASASSRTHNDSGQDTR